MSDLLVSFPSINVPLVNGQKKGVILTTQSRCEREVVQPTGKAKRPIMARAVTDRERIIKSRPSKECKSL